MTNTETAAVPRHKVIGCAGAPMVLALGGISATRHVAWSAVDTAVGWWPRMVGPALALDLTRLQVLGMDYLDGGRAHDGAPVRSVSTHEQAAAIVAVLDHLGVEQLDAVVGASYGGMVALALAERWPSRVRRAVVISAAHESHPLSTAVRAIQRRIAMFGLQTGRAYDAMTLARALAMTTYRSADDFAARFTAAEITAAPAATFDVERYLIHAGEKFAAAMPPERFLALSLSADLHRVIPEEVRVPTVVVAALGDALVPAGQTDELAQRLPHLVAHVTLPSRVGHDAFLVETEPLTTILTSALAD